MEPYYIFFNKWNRLRSGWRFLLYGFVVFLASELLIIALALLFLSLRGRSAGLEFLSGGWGWVIQATSILSMATLIGWLCCKGLEGLPFRALGWALHRGWLVDWLKGTLFGALSLSLAALIIFLWGGYKFSFAASGMMGAVLRTLLFSGLLFVIAAAAEEILFRGYGLQTLTRAQLALVGIIITSLLFAYVHKDNPNNPPGFQPFAYIGLSFINLPFINTALAGVWLAVGYLRTRSLWFPLGLHWSWNWTMGAILGLPVSGIESLTHAPIWRAADAGPVWLTGGAYGVEGGVGCTAAIIISTLFIWRTRLLSATPEMKSLTDRENPKLSVWDEAVQRRDAARERDAEIAGRY